MVREVTAAPKRDQRRETIMNVAREVFFKQGYSAASMSSIAAKLGGSKGTLYNYFKNKEELFAAQVRDLCGRGAERILEATVKGEPVATLSRLGQQYLQHLFSDQTACMFRILIAEAQRSPELGRIFYEAGPARGRKGLEFYLQGATLDGSLNVPDAALGAEQFLALCKGSTHLQFLLNLIPPLTAEEIRAQTGRAVDAFMNLYAPCAGAARR